MGRARESGWPFPGTVSGNFWVPGHPRNLPGHRGQQAIFPGNGYIGGLAFGSHITLNPHHPTRARTFRGIFRKVFRIFQIFQDVFKFSGKPCTPRASCLLLRPAPALHGQYPPPADPSRVLPVLRPSPQPLEGGGITPHPQNFPGQSGILTGHCPQSRGSSAALVHLSSIDFCSTV